MPSQPERLKALSIRQPWAELLIRGEKTVEYRSKATRIRGRIYIYPSLTRSDCDERELEEEYGLDVSKLPRGVVTGTVELVECIGYGDEYEWRFANPQRLAAPLPPLEHPMPVWFHPFGRPAIAAESSPEQTSKHSRSDDGS